jgi:uncharacterized membrane-anchored protein
MSQGNGAKTSSGSHRDPMSVISDGVWKGIGSLIITAFVLLPVALFYEQLPEEIRLFTTPNMLVLIGFILFGLIYYLISKFASFIGRQK